MPKLDETPNNLRPYLFHGVDLTWGSGTHAMGDCPWCGKAGKFSVEIATGMWKCWSCGQGNERGGGNDRVFLRMLWEMSDKATKDYDALAVDRRLLHPETLMTWGVTKSAISGDWLVPGYDVEGKLSQLYKYVRIGDSMKLLATPTLPHQMFSVGHGVSDKKDVIYLCEGPWDAIALWEVMSMAKETDKGLTTTANASRSLLAGASVLGIPGCGAVGTPFQKWLPLFAGKTVCLLFDSDHPRSSPIGTLIPPVGHEATKRAAAILASAKEPPTAIRYLQWGPNGHDPELPSGFDIRDLLTSGEKPLAARITALGGLYGKLCNVPTEWLTGAPTASNSSKGKVALEPVDCRSYRTLVNAWRKAMRWTDGMDRALSVMLASIASTKSVGDQLWIKILGPASCGKSTLCEALSVSKKYVLAKSTMRGFHSGYAEEDDTDYSLVSQVGGKTLITKDGDTLLQSPNLPQILSEARDIYDTVSRTSYRNKSSRDYAGVRMTWILCGTASVRKLDSSELGERFLDCVIMDGIDDDLEDEILSRVAHRAERNLSIEADGSAETHQEPEMTRAMQLTGGYVDRLRETAIDVLPTISMSDSAKHRCTRLGKLVAFMRARPSYFQEEHAEREFAARLVSQHIRLAKCLSLVLNQATVNEEVMRRVVLVALDTARGRTLDIVRQLYSAKQAGMLPDPLAITLAQTTDKMRGLLRFLRQIHAVESYKTEGNRVRWRLTKSMRNLYTEAIENHA